MKIIRKKLALCLLALFAAGGAISSLSAQLVIYRQGFSNNSGSSKPTGGTGTNGYDFYYYNGATATDLTTSVNAVSSSTGVAGGDNVVASAPYGDNNARGYIHISVTTSDVFFYSDFGISRSAFGDISMGMSLRNNSTADITKFAIKVESDWYVSNTDFSAGISGTSWIDVTLDLTGSSLWRSLTFDPGVEMGIAAGPAVALSTITGDITGVGFFGVGIDGNGFRVDTFTISASAIPEPSSAALVVAFGSLLLPRRKSKVKAS